MNDKNKILDWLNDNNLEKNIEPEEPPRKSYDKRIVAWLDILGIREKIKNVEKYDAESIITIMSTMASYVSSACDPYFKSKTLDYIQIADGFMIVADLSMANTVCSILAEIQWNILSKMKMIARGAITVGNVSVTVINNGNFIIGPAYVEAYALESENAIYARIIVADEFLNEVPNAKSISFIKEDTDNVKYVDYIDYTLKTQKINTKRLSEILTQQGVLEELKANYDPTVNKKLSVRQKYGWTISLLKRNKIQNI